MSHCRTYCIGSALPALSPVTERQSVFSGVALKASRANVSRFSRATRCHERSVLLTWTCTVMGSGLSSVFHCHVAQILAFAVFFLRTLCEEHSRDFNELARRSQERQSSRKRWRSSQSKARRASRGRLDFHNFDSICLFLSGGAFAANPAHMQCRFA
jgi:hypothetical protein